MPDDVVGPLLGRVKMLLEAGDKWHGPVKYLAVVRLKQQ